MLLWHRQPSKAGATGVRLGRVEYQNYIDNCYSTGKLPHMFAWEKDVGMEIDEEDWRAWSVRTFKGIMNVSLIETGYKEQSRFIPECLSKMYTGSSPLCFQRCRQEGTMYHTW